MASTSPSVKTQRPKYLHFADQVRRQIATGDLKPGDQLPSFAQMLAHHGLGQGTVERMYATLEEEGLVLREPNRGTYVAKPKGRRATGAIGFAAGSATSAPHPYYIRLLASVQKTAHAARREVVLLHDQSQIDLDKVDGILVCHWHIDRTLRRLPSDLPVVSLVHPAKEAPSVVADESAGIRAATELLLKLGHRRIAYLSCGAQEWVNASSKERMAAYRDTLKAAGIEPLRSWVRPVFHAREKLLPFGQTGYIRTKQWIEDDWRELGCTALLAHNDDVAMGAIDAFQDAGIGVPDEVSVVGFDGTEIAEAFRPRLTTIEVPLDEIGARGVNLLMEQIAMGAARRVRANETIMVPTHLRERNSTAVCRAMSRQLEAVSY